ncbi:MAG: hypothetical protein J7D61_14960 [Marichromatium sp.]|nr:hypothetical protein [Marichromatium sp.]
MSRRWGLVFAAALLIPMVVAADGEWRAGLSAGGEVRVEPETRRAWRVGEDGERRPLWDGVHRLEDGSVVIVREGTVVPSASMQQQWSTDVPMTDEAAVATPSDCDALVEQVCGPAAGCLRSESCRLALELRALALDEARAEGDATETRAQCREALAEGLLGRCGD